MKHFHLILDFVTWEKIRTIAFKKRMSITQLIKDAIAVYLEKGEK